MKETEILRGLDRARAKRAQAAQKFADGVVQAQPQPSPMSLRGLARAVGNGFETMSTGAANLAERVVPIRPRPMPTAAPAPMPVPAAPTPEPAAATPGIGAIGEYSGGMQGTLQRREREAGLYADGVAEVQPSPLSLRGLGRAIGNGFDTMSTGLANMAERAIPIRPRPAPAAPMAVPAPAPVTTPAPVATTPGIGAIGDYAGGMQGALQRREAAAGLRSGVAQLEGPGTETSDDIPAWLSKGEAVLPAKTVQAIGPKNIARLIADTNGKPPVDGIKHGLRASGGAIPGMEVREVFDMGDVRNPNVGAGQASAEAQAWRAAQTPAAAPAPAAPAPAAPKPSLLSRPVGELASGAGRTLRSGVNSKIVKGAGLMTAPMAAVDTALTGTEDYRERFGLGGVGENDNPVTAGLRRVAGDAVADTASDVGARALGFASDLGNALTFGQASRLYRDKQTPDAAPTAAPSAPVKPAAAPAEDRDPYAGSNADKLATGGLRDGVIYRDGNSFSGSNIKAGPMDANPGMGGTAESRAADARASGLYRQMIDEASREGDAVRASAAATNDALERSFNNEQNQREIRRGLSQARYEASKLSGRAKAAALDSILKAEQENATAPDKMDVERTKAAGLNNDAKARMLQTWAQHQDNLAQRQSEQADRRLDASERRAATAAAAAAAAKKTDEENTRKNYEESADEFKNLFDTPDAKGNMQQRKDLEQLAVLTAQRNSGGRWRTMGPAERAKAREDAVETVKFISAARDGQNNEWLQALGLKQPDAVLDYLPQLKGRKLEKAGIWEGASTPNASIGDYVIRMPNGKDMYLPYGKVTEGTLAFLKKQGVDIGGLKNGG